MVLARTGRFVGALGMAAVLMLGVVACGGDDDDDDSAGAAASPTGTLAPVSAVDHANGVQPGPVDVEVDPSAEGVDVTFRTITIQPGAGTGEHCHYGNLVAVVAQGELTHYADMYPEGVHVYKTGDSIIEGSGYIHQGKNEGDENVVLWVTYITPEGKPLAETELANCEG
jgi:quercetin dioxygenase-like cupin family protein